MKKPVIATALINTKYPHKKHYPGSTQIKDPITGLHNSLDLDKIPCRNFTQEYP
jgi:hypothetical protein